MKLTDAEFDRLDQFLDYTFKGAEITVRDENGNLFQSSDLDAILDAIETSDDPWIDLVDSEGVARGLTLYGDPDAVEPAPTYLTDDGMAYLFEEGATLPEQEKGFHFVPVSEIVEVIDPERIALDDLVISTPGSEIEVTLSNGRHRMEKQGQWKPVRSVFGQFSDALQNHQAGKKDGPCFLQGECAGGSRKAMAMIANYIIGIDLDSGKPLEEVKQAILDAGLEAVIYTTHSHLKNTSQIKRDHFLKWNDGEDPTEDSIRDYLMVKKGLIPEIVQNVEIIEDGHHTEEGVVILVAHAPIPKFRAVFPLHEPFVFAKRGGTQKDAISEWKERYAGFCTKLGFFYDETCADPARLFYMPRHPKGAEHGSWWIAGKPVNLDDYDRVKVKRDRRTRSQIAPSDVFAEMAGDEDEDDYNRYIIDGFNLLAWAKDNAKLFEIEDFITSLGLDVIREDRGGKPGVHVECPFEAEHSTFGGGGSFIVNAGDNWQEGYESGFTFACVHDACSHRDRLDFIKGAIEEGWFTVEDLKKTTHLMEVEEEEEDDRPSPTPAASPNQPVYEEPSDDSDLDDETKLIRRMNREYAVVRTPNGVRILVEDPDDPAADIAFYSTSDVATWERGNFVYYTGKGGKTERMRAFDFWMDHPERRKFKKITFNPSGTSPDIYNLYRGFSVEPKEGDWSILKGHLYNNICDGDDKVFDWVMTWMAQLVQEPWKKPGSTIAVKGPKGSGKSTMFEYLGALVEKHYITVSDRSHITGKFNAHLASTLLMVCEEAFWAADPQAEGTLKHMITSPTLLIEKKGIDAVVSTNYTRMVMISNEEWMVPASLGDERRFCVLECSPPHPGESKEVNDAFFGRLRHQMDNEGGKEAMLHELLNYEPKTGSFNCLYDPPKTEHLKSQQIRSLDGLDQFMLSLMRSGLYEPADDDIDPVDLNDDKETVVTAKDLRACVQDYMRYKFTSDRAKTGFDEIADAVFAWFGATEAKVYVEGQANRRREFTFPPLSEARASLPARKGLTVEAMVEQVIERQKY